MKKKYFGGKKRFQFSKMHLYQTGKAQNMPVVAGPLVDNFRPSQFRSEERNTKMDSRVAIFKQKNVDLDIGGRNVAESFGEKYIGVTKKLSCQHCLANSIH